MAVPYELRYMWIESWDGVVTIPLPLEHYTSSAIMLRGLTGLGVAPTDIITEGTPGVPGTRVVDVVNVERPIALPVGFLGDTQQEVHASVQKMRDVTDPGRGMTPEGNFRLVCVSLQGSRELLLSYRSGLEGLDTERRWFDTAVLDCVAPMPFAQDRHDQTVEFTLLVEDIPFLSDAPGTLYPWGTRQLSPTTVAGVGTPIETYSDVPVYPTIEITGPADSVLITAENGLRIDVPTGVPAGSVLRIVTDPRHKSIRMNGLPAAGLLARGSRLTAFPQGTTMVDVSAPGATDATLLKLTWRGLYRSLW